MAQELASYSANLHETSTPFPCPMFCPSSLRF